MGVQLFDGFLGFLVRAHFDEREPSRAPRGFIANDLYRFNGASARKELMELRFGGFVREVSHVQFSTHTLTPVSPSATILDRPRRTASGFRLVTKLNFRRSESGKGSLRPEAAQYAARSDG